MERMLRKKKDNSDYEIDRELTGKFAIESNAELQEKYEELREKYRRLEKEHKSLQVEHSRLLFDMDAVIEYEVDVKCKMLTAKFQKENKKLKERIDELEKCNLNLQERLDRKEELNKSYRKEIKDHQLYEEKLEHRIIEFEELLHGE